MSEQTFQLVQVIRQRLKTTMRRITLADLVFGIILTLGIFLLLWLLAAAVEAGVWLQATPRTFLFWALVLITCGLTSWFLLLPLLRLIGLLPGPSEEKVALRIGSRYPEVSDRLVNLLHLVEGRRSEAPDAMVDSAVRMLGEQVRPVPFEQVEDFHRARRASRVASVPALGLLLFLLAAPTTFLDATSRLFSPGVAFERPAPFQLVVEPGSVELVRGQPLEISVRTVGREHPRVLTLALNNMDEAHVEKVQLTADATGAFRHTVVNVRKSLRYRVSAPPVAGPWYEATVIERPLVRSLQVSLDFPAYTRIPSQRLEPNVGDVTALPGTRVSLEVGTSGQGVEAAFVQFDDGTLDTLALDGRAAAGSFTLHREGSYRILLRNDQGVENSDPITYNLNLLSDAYPAVALLAPDPVAELDETMQVGLRMRINDDFGFSRLRLYYRLSESRFGRPMEDFASLPLPLDRPAQLDQEVAHTWLVTEQTGLDPVPGDEIEYFIQVWDNDAYAGFKTARTEVQRLHLPSLAEQYRQLQEAQDQAEAEMEDLLRQSEAVQHQFQELRDELRRKQETGWEDERQLESIQEQQNRLDERVEQLRQSLESMTNQMEENKLVSDETLEMYRELQRVVEEISSPELQEALRQLQEAMQNLDLQQLQQSLGDFEFNEEQYQQRLERTLDLFKKLRMQQALEEAARRAQELAEQQKRLAEETGELMKQQPEEGRAPQRPEEKQAQEQPPARQDDAAQQDPQDPQQAEQQQDPQQGEQQAEQQDPQQGQQQDPQQGEQQDPQRGEQQQGEQQTGQRSEELAREQERAKEEMEELLEQLEALRQQAEEMRQAPKEQMKQLAQEARQRQMPQQMQQNSEQLRQQQLQQAQQGQQQMQQQLQQMQQQLQQMQQQMQGQQKQVSLSGLRRALDDVLTLSRQQENLRSTVRDLNSDNPQLRAFAQRQVELAEGLSVVSDSLQRLAREIPQMGRAVQQHAGEALREMGASTEAMAERMADQAAGHQKGSMMHLNELALLLADLMNQMMNAQGSGSGMSMEQMIQQMQQMAGQQQQLNQQIQQMLNDMQGNRLSSDQENRLRQMAGQQEAIQRQLRQLSRNPASRGKLLGDLNKIAQQMEETIQELQRGQMNRRTVERQQQILTRMLDAQRSLQERGQEKRREGRSGEDVSRESPGELTPAEQAEKLRRDLIRALESGYAPDYEELIKRYFELLQQQSRENE